MTHPAHDVIVASLRASRLLMRRDGGDPSTLRTLDVVLDGSDEQAEAVTARVRERQGVRLPVVAACAKGCGLCCHQGIILGAPEAVRIAERLRATRGPEELARIKDRLRDYADRVRPLKSTLERHEARLPCPLLHPEEQACTIHEMRPAPCRGQNSSSVSACLAAYEGHDPAAQIPAADQGQQPVTQAVWLGMLAAYAMEGYDARPVELAAGLLYLLEHPDAVERWLHKEPVLAAAETPRSKEFTASRRSTMEEVIAAVRQIEAGGAGKEATGDAARRERNRRKRARRR